MSEEKIKTKKQTDREKTKKLKKAVEAVAANYQDELLNTLGHAERLEYNGAEIFIVGETQFKALVKMEKDGSKKMQIFDLSEKDADFSNKTVNILNKDRKTYAINYRPYMRVTPLILTDEEKVIKRVQAEIGIWANIQRKGMRELFESRDFTEKEKEKIENETASLIEEETDKLRDVINNFEKYDKVIVTNYETARAYPTLYYTDKEGKRQVRHLSIKKPNILWHEDIASTKGQRGDASIAQFVKTSERIANMVYVKRKK